MIVCQVEPENPEHMY